MQRSCNQKIETGLSVSAFLLFALSLVVPSGYSYGALGFVLVSVAALFCRRPGTPAKPGHIALLGIFLVMAAVWALSFDSQLWAGSDYWLKYSLAALGLWVAGRRGLSSVAVGWGIAAGGVGALLIAAYQYLVLGMDKAWGFTNAIQYGGIAMYLGLAAWAWALFARQPRAQAVLMWLCGGCGVLASLLSETRGAWVVAPLLVACMLYVLIQQGRAKQAIGALLAACALLLAVVLPYGDKFVARGQLAVVEFEQYWAHPQQMAETSIGQRMEQWQLAVRLGEERPLLGWGTHGVIARKQQLVDQGLAHPSVMAYGHAHNEILDMWAKRGMLGVLLLLLFYAIPLLVFWPTTKRLQRVAAADRHRAVALRLVAALLPIAYFGFGWTQVFFAHNSGNMFYLFGLVAFYGALRSLEQAENEPAQAVP